MRYCSYKVVPLFSKSERENDGKEEGVDSVTIKEGGKQGTETEGRKEPNKQKKWGEFEFVYFFFFGLLSVQNRSGQKRGLSVSVSEVSQVRKS